MGGGKEGLRGGGFLPVGLEGGEELVGRHFLVLGLDVGLMVEDLADGVQVRFGCWRRIGVVMNEDWRMGGQEDYDSRRFRLMICAERWVLWEGSRTRD